MADINNNSLSEATEDQFQIAVVVLMYSVSVFVFSPSVFLQNLLVNKNSPHHVTLYLYCTKYAFKISNVTIYILYILRDP